MRLEVWLERSGKLWPVVRSVPLTPAIVGAAVSGLLAGPTPAEAAAGAGSAVPAGTQLLGISLHGGVATVDLTSEFEGDGAARQRLGLAQLVYGVTQFPTVHALRLHLDGQPVTAFADGLVLPDPITRTSMGFPRLVPAITVANVPPGTPCGHRSRCAASRMYSRLPSDTGSWMRRATRSRPARWRRRAVRVRRHVLVHDP